VCRAPEIREKYSGKGLRVSSAVLVETKAWQRSFHPVMKVWRAVLSFLSCRRSRADGLPGDDAEEHFHQVEPGSPEVGVKCSAILGFFASQP
jgi:hypothetical protein